MTTHDNRAQKLDALIQQAIAENREVTPPRDLWRGIEASISRSQVTLKRKPSNYWVWFTGAAASIFVIVGVTLSLSMNSVSTTVNGQQLELLTMVTQQHQQQRQILLANYEDAGLQPTFSELQSELEQLRSAAVQVTEQLRLDPDNSELWQFLQWLHQQELDLLKVMYQQPRTYQQV
ncbi:hypothetical protein [Pseudidiomarina marina]|uniref:Uncharacterized protein n=1 Tax=Pseudidiomarina marina TaxID=502366 RepID=A0A432YII8_9GAMM|nr:hypothetical protein [Pseudidiomarina marina]PHR66079.1 MAG: hypothetical protein COA51_03435 [Idiomarina sp.]RUO60773.1 hypothetical protein CWI76_00345 [Pseudidiomarina marina]